MSQIIHLAQARPRAMLERLQRLTGLDFEQMPESLLVAGPVSGGHAGPKKGSSQISANHAAIAARSPRQERRVRREAFASRHITPVPAI